LKKEAIKLYEIIYNFNNLEKNNLDGLKLQPKSINNNNKKSQCKQNDAII
jgi:hypothetical protein